MENQIEQPIAYPSEIQPNQPSVTPPINQPLPVQPSPNPSKQNYLIMAVVVLVILLLGMGGLVVYLLQKNQTVPATVSEVIPTTTPSMVPSPVADETANWKTYTSNSSVGITFKYPPSLTLQEKGQRKDYIVLLTDPKDLSTTSSIMDIDLSLDVVNSDYPQAVNFWKEQLIDESVQELENGVKIVGNGQHESSGEIFTIVLLKHKSGGAIRLVTTKTDNTSKMLFDQILSTFKFTDQIQSSTSNKKTYQGTYFTFKYPSDYKVWEISNKAGDISLGVGEASAGNDWTISINANTKNQESIIADIKNIPENSTLKVISDTSTSFLSLPAREIIVENTPGGKDGYLYKTQSKTIVFSRENLTYVISTQFINSIFDQIISTFQFTK